MQIAVWPEIKNYTDSPGWKHSKHRHLTCAYSHLSVAENYGLPCSANADHWLYPVFLSYTSHGPKYSPSDYIDLPEHIVQKVHAGEITVIFDYSAEALDLIGMHTDTESREFCKKHGIEDNSYPIMCNTIKQFNLPKDRCIFVHASEKAEYQHDLFHSCFVNYFEDVALGNRPNIVSQLEKQKFYIRNLHERKYKTACLAARVRGARSYFAYRAFQNGMLEDNIMTLGMPNHNMPFTGKDDPEFVASLPWLFEDKGVQLDRRSVPQGHFGDVLMESYVSIVHESLDDTLHWKIGNHYNFATEKTFANFFMMRPFVLQTYPNSLVYLHRLGYETFDKWWDESYDQKKGMERVEAVWDIFSMLNQKSHKELAAMLYDMYDVLEHNYDNHEKRSKDRAKWRNLDALLASPAGFEPTLLR